MANNTVTLNTEIRKLKPAHRCALGDILNVSDSWKILMAIVPRNDTNTMRFNSEHVSIIEQMGRKYHHNAAEILLDEWGTMGRKRPTLQTLLDLLIKAQLFRAADYVASEILNVDLPQRPDYGPAAVIDISDETLAKLISEQANLENTGYSKSASIIESSCEVNVGEIKCFPDAIDLMDPCFSKNNLYIDETKKMKLNSTEQDLIKFSTHKLSNKDVTLNDAKSDEITLKSTEKDLIKFSTNVLSSTSVAQHFKNDMKEENKSENSQINKKSSDDCKFQEMSSQELPVFLNNLEQNESRNNELKSAELPTFLNQSSCLLRESVICSDNSSIRTMDSSNSSNSSNCNSNLSNSEHGTNSVHYEIQTEMTSSLLPKCIINQEESGTELYKTNDDNENATISEDLPLTVLEYNK